MVRGSLELLLGGLLLASCVQPTSDDDSGDDDTVPVDDDDYTQDDDDTVGDDDVGDDDTTGNLPPVAEAGGPYYGGVGETMIFNFSQNGTGSYDEDGQIVLYRALWGDNVENYNGFGTMGHGYPFAGEYALTLTVEDDEGATSFDTALVIIN